MVGLGVGDGAGVGLAVPVGAGATEGGTVSVGDAVPVGVGVGWTAELLVEGAADAGEPDGPGLAVAPGVAHAATKKMVNSRASDLRLRIGITSGRIPPPLRMRAAGRDEIGRQS